VSPRPSTTDRPGQETARNGPFAPLASARYLLISTVTSDGAQEATPVRARINGDRAYFRTSGASAISKRLQHTGWVQVAPCAILGFVRYGPAVNATARMLAGEEAGHAAGELARTYPAWRGFLASLSQRLTRRRTVHYELRADDHEPPADPEEPAAPPAVTAPAVRVVRLVPAGDGRRSAH
jgi:PPOX class probable F420-dependent enzyme